MEVRAYPSVTVVDGLFPADTLSRLLETRHLPGVSAQDYGLAEIESLQDAITRSWSRLTAIWTSYRAAIPRISADSRATSITRDRWLRFLFDELGYGPLRPARTGIKVGSDVYPVSHEWEAVPVHLLGWHIPLDRRTAGIAGAATRSPQSLVQGLLNRSDRHCGASSATVGSCCSFVRLPPLSDRRILSSTWRRCLTSGISPTT